MSQLIFRLVFTFLLIDVLPNKTYCQITSWNESSVSCPLGYKCLSNSPRNVTVTFTFNGGLCPGQSAKKCYNETDPRGFVSGPRQMPVAIHQRDRLIAKTSEKYDFAIKLYNVSKSAFDSCNFNGASPVVADLTKSPFEVPTEFIAASGIKYFIAESDNMVIGCQYGFKLEVNVRSRAPCINPSGQDNEVCSSKGLCATLQKFFTANTSCVCNTGYIGSYCEERDSCHKALNPCRNGATCIDRKSGMEDDYNCTCLPGYDGKNCEININDCKSDPCQNGAICLDKLNDYTCLCMPGYFGKNCDKLVAVCDLNPCHNGGICERTGGNRQNYTCHCPLPFRGMNCTDVINSFILETSPSLKVTLQTTLHGINQNTIQATLKSTSNTKTTHRHYIIQNTPQIIKTSLVRPKLLTTKRIIAALSSHRSVTSSSVISSNKLPGLSSSVPDSLSSHFDKLGSQRKRVQYNLNAHEQKQPIRSASQSLDYKAPV